MFDSFLIPVVFRRPNLIDLGAPNIQSEGPLQNEPGSLSYQPKQSTIIREIPQVKITIHLYSLIPLKKMDYLVTPAEAMLFLGVFELTLCHSPQKLWCFVLLIVLRKTIVGNLDVVEDAILATKTPMRCGIMCIHTHHKN